MLSLRGHPHSSVPLRPFALVSSRLAGALMSGDLPMHRQQLSGHQGWSTWPMKGLLGPACGWVMWMAFTEESNRDTGAIFHLMTMKLRFRFNGLFSLIYEYFIYKLCTSTHQFHYFTACQNYFCDVYLPT